jgi:hypothetical protein
LQKAQIAVLVSCQHHLYTADLHQMVLHRPVECTTLIKLSDKSPPATDSW